MCEISFIHFSNFMGQLLVVAKSDENPRQSELIPDPDGLARCLSKTMRPDSWIWDQEKAASFKLQA